MTLTRFREQTFFLANFEDFYRRYLGSGLPATAAPSRLFRSAVSVAHRTSPEGSQRDAELPTRYHSYSRTP